MFDTDIPVPVKRRDGRGLKYPFAQLSPGQSVLYVCDKADSKKVRTAAYTLAKVKGWEVVVRADKTGIRVWRIK